MGAEHGTVTYYRKPRLFESNGSYVTLPIPIVAYLADPGLRGALGAIASLETSNHPVSRQMVIADENDVYLHTWVPGENQVADTGETSNG